MEHPTHEAPLNESESSIGLLRRVEEFFILFRKEIADELRSLLRSHGHQRCACEILGTPRMAYAHRSEQIWVDDFAVVCIN
jgi:hypothetical protein